VLLINNHTISCGFVFVCYASIPFFSAHGVGEFWSLVKCSQQTVSEFSGTHCVECYVIRVLWDVT